MRRHEHHPRCPYNGMPVAQAWRRHLGRSLFAWFVTTVVLYLVIVVVAVCVKAIR